MKSTSAIIMALGIVLSAFSASAAAMDSSMNNGQSIQHPTSLSSNMGES